MAEETMILIAVGMLETTKVYLRSRMAPVILDFRTPKSADELMQLLNARNVKIACVLIDSDYLGDKGVGMCRIVRSVVKTLPILVISSETDRNYYIQAIRWGVTGFLVKPFKDEAVRAKLMECHQAQSDKTVEMISFDLEKYLLGEFRKAEKGRFSLTFMFATILLDDPDEQGNLMSQAYYLNLLYETIRKLFWDTDAFIRLNSKYYLGVFPFCGSANVETLLKKMNSSFNELYNHNVPRYVKLVTAFASYPNDSTKFLELQRIMTDRVRMQMGDFNLDWFI